MTTDELVNALDDGAAGTADHIATLIEDPSHHPLT